MTDIGKPLLFDITKWLDTVEGFIESDDVALAFRLLDMCPAYYKDNMPERAKEIKERLNKQIWTPIQYRGIYDSVVEISKDDSLKQWPLRAEVLYNKVKKLNDNNIYPNIMELAPGSLWIPQLLEKRECIFTYEYLSLDKLNDLFKKSDKPQFNIFIAFEIIEHLWNEYEIYQNYLKFNKPSDIVMLSTPLYTFGGGMGNWRERDLGHLRTYSPQSFGAITMKIFDGFKWSMYKDNTMVLLGQK